MNNGLVTSDGTKVLTVAEYYWFVNFIHWSSVKEFSCLKAIDFMS